MSSHPIAVTTETTDHDPASVRPSVPRRLLSVPRRPDHHLVRPALDRRIRDGSERRLLLVTGPAGQGKTVAVADALRDGEGTAWVSLDTVDPRSMLVWTHVLAALGEACGETAPVVDAAAGEDALLAVCERLATHPHEVVLVVDAGDRPLVGEATRLLGRLLDWAPDQLHLVVISRRRPVIAAERRRVRGEVADLHADDLAFSDVDAVTYLTSTWALPLEADRVSSLVEVSGGWPLGLRLVASGLAAARRVGDEEASTALPPRLGRDLVRELLSELDEPDRRFLLDVAALPVLDPDLCTLVTGRADAADLLLELADRGLVLDLGPARDVFRHRDLLRRPLRDELRVQEPARERAHHSIAAAWFGERGCWTSAVQEAREGGEDAHAVELLESHVDEILLQEGGGWFTEALSRVPTADLLDHPRLVATRADLAVLTGDRGALERLLTALDRAAGERTGDELARRVRAHLSRLRGDGVEPLLFPRGRRRFDPLVAHPLGVALGAEGRHDAAEAAFRRALEDSRHGGDPIRELAVLADLAWERALAGHLVEADLLCRQASELARHTGFEAPPLQVRLARAQLAFDRGRTDVAREEVAAARTTASRTCDLVLRVDVGTFVSRARWAHGDIDGAVRALDELDGELSEHTPGGGLIARLTVARAGLHLAIDDVDAVLSLLPSITGSVEGLPPEDRLVAAMVHLRRGVPDRTIELVETLRGVGVGPRLSIHALRLEASALAAIGDDLRAVDVRRRADRIARIAGLMTPVVHRRVSPPTASLTHAGQIPSERTLAATSPATGPLSEELTGRETAVLQMLATATNGEIAKDLYVSVNTVKTHLKSIYRKLGVTSRAAAVERAIDVGVL